MCLQSSPQTFQTVAGAKEYKNFKPAQAKQEDTHGLDIGLETLLFHLSSAGHFQAIATCLFQ